MNRRALLLAALTGGCSILPQRPYVDRRNWPLTVQRAAARPPNPRGPVLLIRTVSAAAGLDSQGLQTIATDGSIHTDYYERWSVPPAEAVEAAMRRWLLASGLFAGVLPPGSRAPADYALEAELLSLIAAPAQAASRMELGFVLVDLRPGRPKLRQQGVIAGSAPLESLDPAEIARSGRAAAAAVLQGLEERLAASV